MTSMDGRPKYVQIAADLRTKIADGRYPVGSELPSSARLMRMYDVSVTVVRAAVRELRSEGLVMGQPGKGVYVQRKGKPPPPSPEYVEIMEQIDSLRSALDEAVGQLEARVSELERSLPARRSARSAR